MASTTKRRELSQARFQTVYQQTYANGFQPAPQITEATIYSRQSTTSEGHFWPKGRGVRDQGGPFFTWVLKYNNALKNASCSYFVYDSGTEHQYNANGHIPYYGGIPSIFTQATFPADSAVRFYAKGALAGTNLTTLGTKFISQTIPTNPAVDGSVALAELFREGLPSMIGSAFLKERASFFKSLGSEYLNLEFGWKPLISDLQKAAKAVVESEKIIRNLIKHSGKDLRRERLLPSEISTVPAFLNNVNASNLGARWTSPTTLYTTDHTVRQQWFSGCYVYHYEPSRMTELSRIATQARILYGIKLTPDVLWNLAPWSWLVDWFANVGPILSNVSAFQNDGLVLKYGYVMEHTTRSYNRGWYSSKLIPDGALRKDQQLLLNSPCFDEFFCETKERVKATPYGFGLNTAAFTNRQWAILGALGLTRGPKTL